MSPLEVKIERRVQGLSADLDEVAKQDAISDVKKLFDVIEGREDRFNSYFVLENPHNRIMHEYFLEQLNLPSELLTEVDEFGFTDVLTLECTTLSRQYHTDTNGALSGVWYVAGDLRELLVTERPADTTQAAAV